MNAIIISFLSVGISKLISMASGLFLTLYVASQLNIDLAGYFFLFINLLQIFSLLVRQGFDNLVLRDVGGASPDKNVISTTISRTFFLSFLLLCAYWLLRLLFKSIITFDSIIFTLFDFLFVSLVPLSLLNLFAFFFQAKTKFFLSAYCQTFAVNIIFLLIVFLSQLVSFKHSLNTYIFFYMISCYLSYITSALFLLSSDKHVKLLTFTLRLTKEKQEAASYFFKSSICALVVQWGTYLASVFFLNSEEISALSVANRIAFVLSFILTIANTISIPFFLRFIKANEYGDLAVFVRTVSLILYATCIPFVLFLYYYSSHIMGLFGEDYRGYDYVLRILLIGQLINILTGSVGYLLNLTGNERYVSYVSIFTAVFIISTSIPVSSAFGVTGVCLLMTVSISAQNITLLILVKTKLGFYLIPHSSLSSLKKLWFKMHEVK